MTELEYYKKLAALWEKACHDIEAQRPPRSDTPFSYAAAVTFANENIVSIKPVDPAEEAEGVDVAPMRTVTEEQILAIPGVRKGTAEDVEEASPGWLARQAEEMAQDIDREIVDDMITKVELKNAASEADKKLLADIGQRLSEYSNELADIGAEHIKAVLAKGERDAPHSMKALLPVSEVSMGCSVPTPNPCTICGDPNDQQKRCKHVTGPDYGPPPDNPKCIRCGVEKELSKQYGGLRGMSCASTGCTYPDYVKPNIDTISEFTVSAVFKQQDVCVCVCHKTAHHPPSDDGDPVNVGCFRCKDCREFTAVAKASDE